MEPPGGVGRYARAGAASLLVIALCLLALVVAPHAQAMTANQARVHVAASALGTDQHGTGHRLTSPDALGAVSEQSTALTAVAGTGSSSQIASEATADTARMRGPPVEGDR